MIREQYSLVAYSFLKIKQFFIIEKCYSISISSYLYLFSFNININYHIIDKQSSRFLYNLYNQKIVSYDKRISIPILRPHKNDKNFRETR